jgi:hypothetical protein
LHGKDCTAASVVRAQPLRAGPISLFRGGISDLHRHVQQGTRLADRLDAGRASRVAIATCGTGGSVAANVIPRKGLQMKLHRIAVTAAALSIAGVAVAGADHATTNRAAADMTPPPATAMSPGATSTSPDATTAGAASTATTSDLTASPQPGSPSAETRNPTLVRSVQQALKDKGFDAGAADGAWGPSTEKALRDFQQARGLPESGSLDPQTLAMLGVEQQGMGQDQGMTPSSPATQDRGMSGPATQDRGMSSPATGMSSPATQDPRITEQNRLPAARGQTNAD